MTREYQSDPPVSRYSEAFEILGRYYHKRKVLS